MQKKGVGMVVYVGEELGAFKLLSVASRPVILPPEPKLIFVMLLLLPAELAPKTPLKTNLQFDDVPPRFTVLL